MPARKFALVSAAPCWPASSAGSNEHICRTPNDAAPAWTDTCDQETGRLPACPQASRPFDPVAEGWSYPGLFLRTAKAKDKAAAGASFNI